MIGKKWGKNIFSLLFFILLSSISYAQFEDPFLSQSSDQTNAFSIAIPSEQTYKQSSNVLVAVSVFNTTGKLLSPSNGVSCRLQFFNSDNSLAINQEMDFSSDQYNLTLSPTLLSKNLRQEYKVFCNTSTQGGFRTGEFGVSESGLSKNYEQMLLIVILVIAIFLIWLANKNIDLNYAFWSGMLFATIGIYLFRHGYLGIKNFISESFAIVILGVGAYILFRTAVEYMNEANR